MKKRLFLIMLLLSVSIFAKNVSGVDVPESKSIEGKTLVLNGAGIRKKAFLDLYVGSLYLTGKNLDENAIIGDKNIQVIRLDVVSKLVGSKEMEDAIDDGFKASTAPETLNKIKNVVEDFKKAFSTEAIKKGDTFEFIGKDSSVTVVKNGKVLKVVNGEDFKEGLFAIWLGAKPADKNLKKAMLGN